MAGATSLKRLMKEKEPLPPPTEEQQAILDLVQGTKENIMINALAGTGKTKTLELIQEVTSKATPVLYLCFNKSIKIEAEKKFPSTTAVKTLNGLGHGIWSQAIGKRKLDVEKNKTKDQLAELIKTAPKSTQSVLWEVYWDVVDAVGKAKSYGYIPEDKFPTAKHLISREDFHSRLEEKPDELIADLIDEVLTLSIRASYEGYIDFDDQIYMPALFGGAFPKYRDVWVDETQDLNPCNHVMLDKLVRERLIAVGDPCQSIYAFRGAVQAGMSKIQEKFSMTVAPLSVSFRCPEKVVEHARWRVPQFKWIKPGGEVRVLNSLVGASIPDDATILCRNNSPLFRVALRLLAMGRSVSIAGSDLGPRVIGIMRKLGDDDTSQSSLIDSIEAWRAERVAKGNMVAHDIAECMLVFAHCGKTLSQAVAYAEHLFAQKGTIRLFTGHKAKGLEFDTEERPGPVYHLDPWIIGEEEQELNLRYVITTRSANRLYEVDSRCITW